MPAAHALKLANDGDAQETHTVIFVDVDGVLNLGIRDDVGGAPLLFSDANLGHAQRLLEAGGPNAEHEAVRKLVAVADCEYGPDGALGSLVATDPASVSPILAERLAQIIKAAGPNRTVVLSSSWRKPHHRVRASRLEQEIARHLGESFAFDERTPIRDDNSAQGRLQCIGDFLENIKQMPKGKLRLLVLEDFFITPLTGWSCGGIDVEGTEEVEQYLLRRLPDSVPATVRMVHTYHEFVTAQGLSVQVGVGLTTEKFTKAMDFLNDAARDCNEDLSVDSSELEEKIQPEGNDVCGYSDASVATKPSKDFILADPQDQKRLVECLATSLPWFSITSLWSL